MITCEWDKCKHKAVYLIDWNKCPRPVAISPFHDHNFVCEDHMKKIIKDFPFTKKKFDIYELTDQKVKVLFT